MELALVRDHTVPDRQQHIRLKLHFEDKNILSPRQIHEGLCDCWFLMDGNLHTIAELSAHIMVAFGLRSSCPHGVFLQMENFTLPPSQPIQLLKDKDLVSVKKKGVIFEAHEQLEHAFSSSFDTIERIAPLGVKADALKEFERETGGYESEEEEENNALQKFAKETDGRLLKPNLRNSREKKRKRQNPERTEDQGLELVPYKVDVDGEKEKGKRKKKQRLEKQPAGTEDLEISTERKEWEVQKREIIEGPQSVIVSEKMKKKRDKYKGHKAESNKAVTNGDNKPILKGGDITINEHDDGEEEIVVDKRLSVREKGNQQSSGTHQEEGEILKKCSRSTLRKKAKRRWRREHLGSGAQAICKSEGDLAKPISEKGDAERTCVSLANKREDDGDAEEERLPRVVRPGHIRFQASEEDDDDHFESQTTPLPSLGWTSGISKRKGQSWGQERTNRGYSSFQITASEGMDNDAHYLTVETLPALEGEPQPGDVIAYRILQLTSAGCPELSEYQVGEVLEFESQSGRLKLTDVAKYKVHKLNDFNPYEDGVLETDTSCLAEILLVERTSNKTSEKLESINQANTQTISEKANTNLKSDNAVGSDSMDVSNALLVASTTESPVAGWAEISEALQRKREELENKGTKGVASVPFKNGDSQEQGSGGIIAMDTEKVNTKDRDGLVVRKPLTDGHRWHRRAGGLGSTMAFLRSQNTV
ncbi:hypothetical protein KP509_31G019000 [Ceratopteris richardii]|uniref:Coilin n=2 Tax=Ceratopteris richardii TaxID=49495 RepID=A0A8T2QWM6_CERRI|nr:hypothetical protein KP509_31G019000 [Ceratopteris richardii]